jgi:hypothetical protein
MFRNLLAAALLTVAAVPAIADPAPFSLTIYPGSTDLATLQQGRPACAAGAKLSFHKQAGPVKNARSGAFVLVLGHPGARLNGVYRIVAVAQDINDGRIVTLFRAECVTV